MKNSKKILFTFVLGTALAASTAFSQPFPGATWTLDENGRASRMTLDEKLRDMERFAERFMH